MNSQKVNRFHERRYAKSCAPTLFIAPFVPRTSTLSGASPISSVSRRSAPFLAVAVSPSPRSNADNEHGKYYDSAGRPTQRRTRSMMKEIMAAQQLRKGGKWKEAQELLVTVKDEAETDSNYLNEMLHIRAAELCQTQPSISAADMYDELYSLAESLPARSNATTFNAILLGLRNISGSRRGPQKGEGSVDLDVASRVFDTMLNKHLFPDHFTMSILFQMCATKRSLHHTKAFQERAEDAFGFEANVVSGSALLAAYAKCGEIDCFEKVLEDLKSRNVSLNERTYASVISAYLRSGKHAKVMECFHAAMNSRSVQPNIYLFSGALASCWRKKDSTNARHVFETMERLKVTPTMGIFETLFDAALRGGDVYLGAKVLFEWSSKYDIEIATLSRVNKLIASCKKSLISTDRTIACLKTVLSELKKRPDLKPEIATLNALISSFVKLGCYSEAQMVLETGFSAFEILPDVVTYNTLIHGLGMVRGPSFAMKVFEVMQKNNVAPNQFTYNTLIDILLRAGETAKASIIGAKMMVNGGGEIDSMQTSSQLKLFRAMKKPREALQVYREAVNTDREVDGVTHGLMLTILLEFNCEKEAIGLFGKLMLEQQASPGVFNVMLDHFGRGSKDPSTALQLFDQMKEKGIAPDDTTYATLIHTCARAGRIDRAFRLLGEMQDVGVGALDTHAWTSLIHGCGRAGQWERAVDLLKSMHDSGSRYQFIPRPNTSCYNAAIYSAGMGGGGWKNALEMYQLLQADEDQEADAVTYSSMASTILRNRFEVSEWGVVREVCQGLTQSVESEDSAGGGSQGAERSGANGKGDKSPKKLAQKLKRLRWLLSQAVEGKKLKENTPASVDSDGAE